VSFLKKKKTKRKEFSFFFQANWNERRFSSLNLIAISYKIKFPQFLQMFFQFFFLFYKAHRFPEPLNLAVLEAPVFRFKRTKKEVKVSLFEQN